MGKRKRKSHRIRSGCMCAVCKRYRREYNAEVNIARALQRENLRQRAKDFVATLQGEPDVLEFIKHRVSLYPLRLSTPNTQEERKHVQVSR